MAELRDYQKENLAKIREEHHQNALKRLRNLRSKEPNRKIAQRLYESVVELYVLLNMDPDSKHTKQYAKKARLKANEAMHDAKEQGFHTAKPLTKAQRRGEP